MTKLARYLFGIGAVTNIATRTINGHSWYMASDICQLLGIANHSQAVHNSREDNLKPLESEWRKESIYIGGYGKKKVLLVNNGGMLKLIYQAKTPAALAVQELIRGIPEHLIPEEWADYFTEKD